MNDDERTKEALFRHAILGEVLSRSLRKGQLRPLLTEMSGKTFEDYRGCSRQMAFKTLEEWLYKYRNGGFEALKPQPRSDQGQSRVLTPDLEQLVVDLKQEDAGRSAPLILRELELAGRITRGQASVSAIQRVLRRKGLSIPKMELDVPARYRWEASMAGELWQADALHGPVLINPASHRPQRVIIFGLLDDRSRVIPYLEAGFGETEHRFLTVLHAAIARRGIPRRLLLDNHKSFTGQDLRVLCAKLDIHIVHSRPGDAPTKGKLERFWRTFRAHLIDRLDLKEVTTLDELNLRIWSYVEAEYHNRPHSSLSGKTPSEVWECDAADIRWITDHSLLEQAFHGEVERLARNDSTVQWRGSWYEVPPYLRGRKVRLRYSLLDTTRVSLLDANVEIPLRAVDPIGNAHRHRNTSQPAVVEKPKTGLNAPDLILENMIRPDPAQPQNPATGEATGEQTQNGGDENE
jgi:putative transposase